MACLRLWLLRPSLFMTQAKLFTWNNLRQDLPAGIVVFLVALPLCLGIALASGAPLFSGILAGIIGGLVVALISGSSTSVSGPAAGLAAIVVVQLELLGSFERFLLATFFAGVLQLAMGALRAGSLSSFFPSSVVKGLLAAIGILLILKQIPHLVGHDPDPIGDMAFEQTDHQNTFTELWQTLGDMQPAAIVIGLVSVLLLVGWDRVAPLKKLGIPVPLLVVVAGVGLQLFFSSLGGTWSLNQDHLVQVPVLASLSDIGSLVVFPDFSGVTDGGVYVAAITIAVVASLETLLNLDAVDNLDPKQRTSPPNRELFAQGVGNMLAGLLGALPMTSVVVRSSVNVSAGNATKMSAVIHAMLLVLCVLFVPQILNMIPLACLAAILIVTGFKLASPKLIKRMYNEGRAQFLPFAFTILAIIGTDLLKGVLAGLVVSLTFILHSNLRRPVRKIIEQHLTGEVLRIELGQQVSFLNKASLEETLDGLSENSQVLLDARAADYIDPDILHLIHDFQDQKAVARGIEVSLIGFKEHYSRLPDRVLFEDFSTRERQQQATPGEVLELLHAGNDRFLKGERLHRNWARQVSETAKGQAPLAVVLSCIDSRNSSELLFDLGIGDVFSVRIAGNIARDKVLGSMEYSCVVAGAKLIVVMGHTSCGAVTSAVKSHGHPDMIKEATGCTHIDPLLDEIHLSIPEDRGAPEDEDQFANYVDEVALRHVERTMRKIPQESEALRRLIDRGEVGIVGALYDVKTGRVEFCFADGPLKANLEGVMVAASSRRLAEVSAARSDQSLSFLLDRARSSGSTNES